MCLLFFFIIFPIGVFGRGFCNFYGEKLFVKECESERECVSVGQW